MVHCEWHKESPLPGLSVACIGKWTMSSFRQYILLPKSCPSGMWTTLTRRSSFHSQWSDGCKDEVCTVWLIFHSVIDGEHLSELDVILITAPLLTRRVPGWQSCSAVSCAMTSESTRCGRLVYCRITASWRRRTSLFRNKCLCWDRTRWDQEDGTHVLNGVVIVVTFSWLWLDTSLVFGSNIIT